MNTFTDEELYSFVRGRGHPSRAAEIERACATDDEVRKQVEQYRALAALRDAAVSVDVSTEGSIADSVMDAVTQKRAQPGAVRRGFRTVHYLSLGGGLLVAVFGLLLALDGSTPSVVGGHYAGGGGTGVVTADGSSYSEASYQDFLVRGAVGNLFRLVEGAFGALVMVLCLSCSAILALIYRTTRRPVRGWSVVFLVLAVFVFALRELVGLFFGSAQ